MLYGNTFNDEDCVRYLTAKSARLARYPYFGPRIMKCVRNNVETINAIRLDGVIVCRGLLLKKDVVKLGTEVGIQVAKGRHGRIRDHRREIDENRAIGDYLYVEESDRPLGEDAIRHVAGNISMASPLTTLKGAASLVFTRHMIDIATAYFECTPMISFVKVQKLFANDIAPVDNQLFHADAGSFRLLKALVYLNDVDMDGEQFVYVRSSHLKRSEDWLTKDRFSDKEIERSYGKENVLAITAKAGNVVFFEGTGIHKGLKPVVCDRQALIVNFCVQEEYGFAFDPVKIGKDEYNGLLDFEKAVADGLVQE